jgi:protein SCO1
MFAGATALASLLGVTGVPAAPNGALGRESTIDPAIMRIDEPRHLGARLDPGFVLTDSNGRDFRLGEILGKPVILLFSYYGCDGACPTINRSLADVVQQVQRFALGRDYRVLTVSFDRQDTQETARRFVDRFRSALPAVEGWRHAVLKQREGDIGALTGSVGYRYFWSRADQVFLHPNVLVFLTPEGRVARYLYGTAVEKKEVELALIDADWGRISNVGAVFDMLTGVCFSYNFAEGRYTYNMSLLVGVASLVAGILLVLLSLMVFRTKKSRRLTYA